MTLARFILILWIGCIRIIRSNAMETSGPNNLAQGGCHRGERSQHTWDGRPSLDEAFSLPKRLLEKYKLHDSKFMELKWGLDDSLGAGELGCQTLQMRHFEPNEGDHDLPLPLDELQFHGTTTLSFICKDGIIVAVDSRASMGQYVGSQTTRKVFPISKYMIGTMAGGAADCAHYIRYVTRVAKLLENRSGSSTPVKTVATLLAQNLREARQAKLSVGTMICGWDMPGEAGAGPCIFYVDSEGCCIGGEHFCVGSGANHAYSVIDGKDWSRMNKTEAVKLASTAIRMATRRDGYSGGFINVFFISEEGIEHVHRARAGVGVGATQPALEK